MSKALLIADRPDDRHCLKRCLEGMGHEVQGMPSGSGALELIRKEPFDILLLDLPLTQILAADLLVQIHEQVGELPVVVLTGDSEGSAMREALCLGVFELLVKPVDMDHLAGVMARIARDPAEPQAMAISTAAHIAFEGPLMLGRHPRMIALRAQLAHLDRGSRAMLIQGEEGTEKEHVARAIHEAGAAPGPLVFLDCTGIHRSGWEAVIYGSRGRPSGCSRTCGIAGKLEEARNGTLFLNEVAEIPPEIQLRLLDMLAKRRYQREAGAAPVPLRTRILLATSRDLKGTLGPDLALVEELLNRGHEVFFLPPLRERSRDLELLIRYWLGRISATLQRPLHGISRTALERLREAPWTDNLRELIALLTCAVAHCRGYMVEDDDFPSPAAFAMVDARIDRPLQTLLEIEKHYISFALARLHWNITHTARALRISPTTLRKKIADFRLRRSPVRSSGQLLGTRFWAHLPPESGP